MNGHVSPVGVLVPPLPVVHAAAKPLHSAAAAAGNSLSGGTAGGSRRSIALKTAVAAAAVACVLGGLAWFRRRVVRSRRHLPPSG
jgi:lysozyme family protein